MTDTDIELAGDVLQYRRERDKARVDARAAKAELKRLRGKIAELSRQSDRMKAAMTAFDHELQSLQKVAIGYYEG